MRAVMDTPGTKDPVVLHRRDILYVREQGGLTLADAKVVVAAAEAGDAACMLSVARAHALNLFAGKYEPGCIARGA